MVSFGDAFEFAALGPEGFSLVFDPVESSELFLSVDGTELKPVLAIPLLGARTWTWMKILGNCETC